MADVIHIQMINGQALDVDLCDLQCAGDIRQHVSSVLGGCNSSQVRLVCEGNILKSSMPAQDLRTMEVFAVVEPVLSAEECQSCFDALAGITGAWWSDFRVDPMVIKKHLRKYDAEISQEEMEAFVAKCEKRALWDKHGLHYDMFEAMMMCDDFYDARRSLLQAIRVE